MGALGEEPWMELSEETMLRVRLTEIEWDTESDGTIHDVDLPTEMTVDLNAFDGDDENEIGHLALDAASDHTGWCIIQAQIEILAEG
jgi:hypothetical protein